MIYANFQTIYINLSQCEWNANNNQFNQIYDSLAL
jgi:hypothetical protein